MNSTFKIPLHKPWTVLDDRIVIGKEEILFSDIDSVKLLTKSTTLTNAVIQIKTKNKILSLAYIHKDRDAGEKAYQYIYENYNPQINEAEEKDSDELEAKIRLLSNETNLWLVKKEISKLTKIIFSHEEIKAITSGMHDDKRMLLLCTNERLLMLDQEFLTASNMIEIPLSKMKSIAAESGLKSGTLIIHAGFKKRKVEHVANKTLDYFIEATNQAIQHNK